jgi:hypothetical protein
VPLLRLTCIGTDRPGTGGGLRRWANASTFTGHALLPVAFVQRRETFMSSSTPCDCALKPQSGSLMLSSP